jgi:hypothetical protein
VKYGVSYKLFYAESFIKKVPKGEYVIKILEV